MAKIDIYHQIDVSLPKQAYPIVICRNGLREPDYLRSFVQSTQVCIVTNRTIAPLYLNPIKSLFSSIQCDVVILEDGEKYKNKDSLFEIYNSLIENKHHRDSTLIALGGGVIGDMAGFAASTYQRGIRLIQIPTTLLAQIDASIGGKTAINHPLAKNMIGSFYHPSLVFIDLDSLKSLPVREFRAGLAEMIKYALLAGGDLFKTLKQSLASGLTVQSKDLPHLISQSCQIKVDVVQNDEQEAGERALLNLGHTFAHALETYTEYKTWLHGEAVAIGLYCAALLSFKLDLLDESFVNDIKEMLHYAGLPHQIPAKVDLKKLVEIMRLDKKIKNNQLRFVLIRQPGDCYLEDGITIDSLLNILSLAQGENSD